MRATFYEALEIPSTAETSTIRSALRAILRRYWSVPRDPSGDTEEAVRFVALGAATLVDDKRREEYDAQARRGATTNPWRVGNDGLALSGADGKALGLPGSHGAESGQLSMTPGESRLIPAVYALTDPLPDKDLWDRGAMFAFAAFAAALSLVFAYFAMVTLVPTMWAIGVLVLPIVVAAVIGGQLQIAINELSGFTLSRLVVTKWRRESSVFIGNPPPAQDTAWIFRLRVMELTRSAAGYSSAPNIPLRIWARLADYSMIAIAWAALLVVFGEWMPSANAAFELMLSPFVLPVLVVVTAIPVEAATVAAWRTTPGKFMMGVAVATGVTQTEDIVAPTRTQRAWARAISAAGAGMCFGVWPLLFARINRHLKSLRVTEGAWDAAADSVTVARASPSSLRIAAVLIVFATSIGLLSLWASDAKQFAHWASARLTALSATAPKSSKVNDHTSAAASANTSPTLPQNTPAPADTAPATGAATASPPVTSSAAQPSSVPTVAPKASPNVPTQGAPVANEFERQTALAQARRARIEAAERRAAAARSSGSYAGLQGICERWTEDQPGSAEAWRCLGLARAQGGSGRDALPALRQAIKLDPNDAQVEAAIFKILRP